MDDNEKVSTLKCMGFNEPQALQALRMCNGNMDLAVDRLVSGLIPSTSSNDTTNTNTTNNDKNNSTELQSLAHMNMIQTSISQYSLPAGKSACTCIAIETSSTLLQYLNSNSNSNTTTVDNINIEQFLTAARLQSMVLAGSDLYNSLKQSQSGISSEVEHLSPEEVLAFLHSSKPDTTTSTSTNLKQQNIKLMEGGVRQGILTSGDGPLGLQSLIQGCQLDQNPGQWICVIVTKTPETVCILLPPAMAAPAAVADGTVHQQQQPFVLIDSHPRPMFGADGAYALFHDSLHGLVNSLQRMFPATDLGSDVGELMAAMYNSFDMYPLTNK